MNKSHSEEKKPEIMVITSLEEPKKEWEMGELNTCQQCHEIWPSRLMELHMHVRHGL